MRTVGEILRKTRREKKVSLAEVAKELKIKEEYLVALESDKYQKLPSLPFAQGFIKNYGQFLDLKPKVLLAIFRRDFKNPVKKQILPEGLINPLKTGSFSWTPKITVVLIVMVVVAFIAIYLFWQYQSLIKAPYFRP